jgi:hypothetical protein
MCRTSSKIGFLQGAVELGQFSVVDLGLFTGEPGARD